MRHSAKNGYLLHYLHSAAAGAALCVNTLLQPLFPFVALRHADVTLGLTRCVDGA